MSLAQDHAADLHLLTPEEIDLCEKVRLHPKPYLVIKETIMKEGLKTNGQLKKKQVREIAKIDSSKGGRLFEFFVASGWISRA